MHTGNPINVNSKKEAVQAVGRLIEDHKIDSHPPTFSELIKLVKVAGTPLARSAYFM